MAPDSLAPARQRCDFSAGDSVAKTVDDAPTISKLRDRVDHVFVILRENRSYDHLLGEHHVQHDALAGDEWNPDPSTRTRVARFHERHYCTRSPGHEWNDVHLQYNGGRLDGFVAATNDSGSASDIGENKGGCVAMGYYDRSDVPLYYWLADQFATSEAYHSSLLGPTLPNLLFYFYATSCNATGNLESALDPWVTKACIDRETIFDRLAAGGHSVQVYGDQRPLALVSGAASLAKYFGVRSIAQLRQDLQSPATLAKVVFIEPNYKNGGDFPPGVDRGTQNDEHPPSNIQDGQVFVHDVVGAIMDQPALFERSVIFITWDEHGGYYDHVAPPAACPPDLHRTVEPRPATFEFDRLGFRVPFFAISPLAKKGYASTITADHTSILRFIETWTDIGALTDRDANAWPLLDMFDFDAAPRTDIPPLPSFTKSTDPTHVSRCGSDKEESSCSLP